MAAGPSNGLSGGSRVLSGRAAWILQQIGESNLLSGGFERDSSPRRAKTGSKHAESGVHRLGGVLLEPGSRPGAVLEVPGLLSINEQEAESREDRPGLAALL